MWSGSSSLTELTELITWLYFWETFRFYCALLPAHPFEYKGLQVFELFCQWCGNGFFQDALPFFTPSEGVFPSHYWFSNTAQDQSCLFCLWVGYNFKVKNPQPTNHTQTTKSGLTFLACFVCGRAGGWWTFPVLNHTVFSRFSTSQCAHLLGSNVDPVRYSHRAIGQVKDHWLLQS